MRSAALSLLLLLAAPSALGFPMPTDCGLGSSGATSCYNGATFRSAAGTPVGSPTSLSMQSYPANSVCVIWQFHCTTPFAAAVAIAHASLPGGIVAQMLPCYAATMNMSVTVATGMDATTCAGGLPLVTSLASFLDSWAAWTPAPVVSSSVAARPAALVLAVTALLLAAL